MRKDYKKYFLYCIQLTLFIIIASMPKISLEFLPTTTVHAAYKKPIKSDIKKVLSLKVNGYQDMTLKDFSNYMSKIYEKNRSIWKARQRIARCNITTLTDAQKKSMKLSEDDYRFLTITIPCTESESTYSRDRVNSTPPDFTRMFDIYSKSKDTLCHFEYCVRYSTDFSKITVGKRDEIILNIIKGMEDFVKKSTVDASKKAFNKKINKKLDTLLKKYATPEVKLEVFQYPAK